MYWGDGHDKQSARIVVRVNAEEAQLLLRAARLQEHVRYSTSRRADVATFVRRAALDAAQAVASKKKK